MFEYIREKEPDPVPESTDENIKFLLNLMLKKSPDKRPLVSTIMNYDFI